MDIATKDNRIVWVDLEMTGLDPARHVIVEVAALVTDAELNIIDEGVDLVVHATDAELAEMDDVVTQMHSDNGLLDEIKASPSVSRRRRMRCSRSLRSTATLRTPHRWRATRLPQTARSSGRRCRASTLRCTTA